jgi:hypothetical protein
MSQPNADSAVSQRGSHERLATVPLAAIELLLIVSIACPGTLFRRSLVDDRFRA